MSQSPLPLVADVATWFRKHLYQSGGLVVVAYTRSFALNLGASRTGLTLAAQLVDQAGTAVGTSTTSGFVELSPGSYSWTGSIPAGHRGAVKFSAGSTQLGALAVNPEECEYVDVKVSSRSGFDPSATGVKLDLTQAIPATPVVGSTGEALQAARAQGFGRWAITTSGSTSTLTIYGPDGTTAVKTFAIPLDVSGNPTSGRTPQ